MALVIIPKGSTSIPTVADTDSVVSQEGGQTLTSNLDHTALATGITNFTIGGTSIVSTTPNVPLHTAITGVLRNAGAGGVLYVRPKGSGADKIARCIHTGMGTTHFVTGGLVDDVSCLQGTVRIDEAVLANTLACSGGTIVQGFNLTPNTTWYISNGLLNTGRGLTGNGWIGHGATVIVKRQETNQTRPEHASGTLTIFGTLRWQGGDMDDVVGLGGGMLDLSDVTADMTIGSLTCTAAFRDRSILESKHPGVTVTISTLTIIDGLAEADGKNFS